MNNQLPNCGLKTAELKTANSKLSRSMYFPSFISWLLFKKLFLLTFIQYWKIIN